MNEPSDDELIPNVSFFIPLILHSHSWAEIGIILQVGYRMNVQGTLQRPNERAIPLGRPRPENRGSVIEIFVNTGSGSSRKTPSWRTGCGSHGEHHGIGYRACRGKPHFGLACAWGDVLGGRPDEILTDPALRPGNICNPPTGHGWGLGGKIGPIV